MNNIIHMLVISKSLWNIWLIGLRYINQVQKMHLGVLVHEEEGQSNLLHKKCTSFVQYLQRSNNTSNELMVQQNMDNLPSF